MTDTLDTKNFTKRDQPWLCTQHTHHGCAHRLVGGWSLLVKSQRANDTRNYTTHHGGYSARSLTIGIAEFTKRTTQLQGGGPVGQLLRANDLTWSRRQACETQTRLAKTAPPEIHAVFRPNRKRTADGERLPNPRLPDRPARRRGTQNNTFRTHDHRTRLYE